MADITVIWDGRGSLHDIFSEPRTVLLWQQRSNALADAAPGREGMITYREAYPEYKQYQRKAARTPIQRSALNARRAKARAEGKCSRCCTQQPRPGYV